MAVDRDYLVGLGLTLQDDAQQAIQAQIEAAIAKIPPVQLKIGNTADLERLASTLQRVTTAGDNSSSAISRTAAALTKTTDAERQAAKAANDLQRAQESYSRDSFNAQVKLNNELERSLNLFSRMNEKSNNLSSIAQQGVRDGRANYPAAGDNSAMFNGSSVDDLMARSRNMSNAVNSVFSYMANELDKTHQAEDAFAQAMRGAGAGGGATSNASEQFRGISEVAAQYGALTTAIDRNNGIIDNNIGRARAAAEAHRQTAMALPTEIANYHGLTDELMHQLTTFAEWAAMAKIVEGASKLVSDGMKNAMQSQREQVLQSFYYQAQGKSFNPIVSNTTMNEAIEMARLYGDDVMHVQEAIGLWAKDTKGELVPAIAMANEALKLNAVSGMDMEQIYRETTAILYQTNQPLSMQAHLYDVAVAAATRYGGAMQSLEGQSDDMVKQMVEGIAEASVEFSKVGMSFEQMGAMISVVVQNFGEKMSGNMAGARLADALAGITESSKAVKALQDAGISLHNNDNFLDEIAQHWDKIGSSVEGAIRKVDRPVWDAVIKNFKEVDDAVAHLVATASQGTLDKLFEKTMGTTAFQVLQLKSGFEALGIVLGKDVLPTFQGVVEYANEAVPVLISFHKSISDISSAGVKIGAIYIAFSALRSLFTMVARSATDSFNAVNNALNGTARYEALAAIPLTAYQKQLVSVMTTDGEVSAAMEANIKAVAAQTGLSVDQVILKLGELNGAWTQTEAQVVSKATVMDAAIRGIATTTTTTAEETEAASVAMRGAFSGMEAGAVSAAMGIATAFSKAIPVIGAVITAISLGFTAKQMWDDYQADAAVKHMKADPRFRQQQMHAANVDASQANAANNDVYFVPGNQDRPDQWISRSTGLQVDPSVRQDYRGRIQHDQQIIQEGTQAAALGNQNGGGSLKDIEAQLRKTEEQAQLALHMKATNPNTLTDNPLGDAAKVKTPKGPDAARQTASALSLVKDTNDKILAQEAQKVTADQAAIERAKAIINLNNLSASSVAQLGKAYSKEEADLKKEISTLQAQEGEESKSHDALLKKAAEAGGTKTKLGEEYIRAARQMGTESIAAGNKIAELKKQLDQVVIAHKLAVLEFNRKLTTGETQGLSSIYNNDILGLKSAGKSATESQLLSSSNDANKLADALENAAKQYENMGAKGQQIAESLRSQEEKVRSNADAWKQRADAIVQNDQTIDERLSTAIQDQQLELHSPYDSNVQSAFKAMMTLERQFQSDMKQLQLADDTAGKAAEQMWYNNAVQIEKNKLALAEYNQEVQQLKQTALFQAFSGAIDSAGSSLTSSFVNQMDGTTGTNNQILALQGQVTSLENERNLLVGQYYDTQRTQMGNEINELNDKIKELQTTMNNPSLGKKLLDDFTKGLADGFMKQFEDELKQSLINQFLPKFDTSVNTQQQTLDSFDKTVNGQLNQSFSDWVTAWDNGMPVLKDLTQQLKELNSGSVTSNDGTPIGTIQGLNDTLNGSTPVSFNANSNASGGGIGSSVIGMGASVAAFGASAVLAKVFGASVPIGSGTGYVNPDGTVANSAGSAVDMSSVFDVSAADAQYGATAQTQDQFSSLDNITSLADQNGPPTGSNNKSVGADQIKNALGDAAMAYQGVQTGGVAGGLEAGMGTFQGLSQLGVPPQVSIPIAAAVGLFAAFSHHDNPALMPDKYDTQEYGQDLANLMGSGFGGAPMEANGQNFSENSTLAKEIGNQGELSYIAQFIQNNPSAAKQVLTPQELAMFTGLKVGAGNITGGGNGYETLQNGQSVQWQQLVQSVQAAVGAIQNFTNVANQATQPLIAIQSFGSGKLPQGFSPYYTPGFSNYYSDYMKNTPYYAYNASPSNAAGGSTSNGMQAPGVSASGGSIKLTSNLVLGGRTLAQIIQNLQYRLSSAGWQLP